MIVSGTVVHNDAVWVAGIVLWGLIAPSIYTTVVWCGVNVRALHAERSATVHVSTMP